MFIPVSLLVVLVALMTVAVCTVVFNTLSTAKMASNYRTILGNYETLTQVAQSHDKLMQAIDEGAGEKLADIAKRLAEHEQAIEELSLALAPEAPKAPTAS